MAVFAAINGTLQPVFNLDTQDGPIAGATSLAGLPVQPQGPKLDFFTITANASLNTTGNTGGYLANVIQQVQIKGTVAMYQVNGAQLSLAVYPTGAYTAATLAAQVQEANATGGVNIGIETGNVVTVGFKLATS
jgi:hypothetical protein